MAISADLGSILHKKYEDKDLKEILNAPVSALEGVSDGDAELLKKAFNVNSVGDLGRNKYFRAAQALVHLGDSGAK